VQEVANYMFVKLFLIRLITWKNIPMWRHNKSKKWHCSTTLHSWCWWQQGSISSTFSNQPLRAKIPKAQKDSQVVSLFCAQKLLVKHWWNWHQKLNNISKLIIVMDVTVTLLQYVQGNDNNIFTQMMMYHVQHTFLCCVK